MFNINYSKQLFNVHDPDVIVKNNKIIFLKSLLIGGADPNIQNNYYRDTPLHIRTNIDIIKLLLEYVKK